MAAAVVVCPHVTVPASPAVPLCPPVPQTHTRMRAVHTCCVVLVRRATLPAARESSKRSHARLRNQQKTVRAQSSAVNSGRGSPSTLTF